MPNKEYLKLRGEIWYFCRRVPKRIGHLDRRKWVRQSLETRDRALAVKKARAANAELETFWDHLDAARASAAKSSEEAFRRICRAHGFSAKSAADLEAASELRELIARVETLISAVGASALNAQAPPPREVEDALLGISAPGSMTISQMAEFYFENSGDKTVRKSDRQKHKWALPRRAAIKELIDNIGDIPLEDVDRDRLWVWRDGLWDRIEKGDLIPASANKSISYVSAMMRDVAHKKRIDVPDLSGLRFANRRDADGGRQPYQTDEIVDFFLAGSRLAGLNEEARRVIFAMIETGMRPSEIVNIMPENIVLDAEIPHVRIRATKGRELKTAASRRDVPLVGVSLMAFEAQREGWPRYRDKTDLLSRTIGKFMSENGLRPTPRHTLYSLRHSFEDRMSEAESPDGKDDRFRAALMGHKYTEREKYGQGPSLKRKQQLLQEIMLPAPSRI